MLTVAECCDDVFDGQGSGSEGHGRLAQQLQTHRGNLTDGGQGTGVSGRYYCLRGRGGVRTGRGVRHIQKTSDRRQDGGRKMVGGTINKEGG